MMSLKDIEEVRAMAEVWRLNDERNRKIAAEKQQDRERYKVIDDSVQE
jgi:hypothetical protein